MAPGHIEILFLVLFSCAALCLLFIAVTRIPDKMLRLSLVAMLIASLLYLIPANIFASAWGDATFKFNITRVAFSGALLLAGSVTVFITIFTDNLAEFSRWRFRLFVGWLTFLLGATAGTGLIFSGAVVGAERPTLIYGPLHPVFVGSYLVFFIYFSFLGWRGYRRCQSEMLQVQLKALGLAGVLSFGAIVVANGVLPAFLGRSSGIPFATACVLAFYGTILYIILNGETLVVIRSVRDLLKEPLFRLSENRQALRMYIHNLKHVLLKNPQEMHRRVSFRTPDGEERSLFVSKGERFEAGPISFDEGVPMEWYTGAQRNAARLEQENIRLSIGLESARTVMRQNEIEPPPAVEPLPFPTPVGAPVAMLGESAGEDVVETLAVELKNPGHTFTRQEALDVLHEAEFEQELDKGTIIQVSDRLFRLATPRRYERLFGDE